MKLAQYVKVYEEVYNTCLNLSSLQMAVETLDEAIRAMYPNPEQRGSKYDHAFSVMNEQIEIFYFGLLQDLGDGTANGNYEEMSDRINTAKEAVGYIKTKIEQVATYFKINFIIELT